MFKTIILMVFQNNLKTAMRNKNMFTLFPSFLFLFPFPRFHVKNPDVALGMLWTKLA